MRYAESQLDSVRKAKILLGGEFTCTITVYDDHGAAGVKHRVYLGVPNMVGQYCGNAQRAKST